MIMVFCNSADQKINQKNWLLFAQAAHETRDGADSKFNDGLMLKENWIRQIPISLRMWFILQLRVKYYGRGPLQ
ncbi:hypothetical protein CS542_01690 [Pedobacter sp. IW39]|nr:hypothetical protein CS542_01690 [Pedobacter sp. IW39]